MEAIRKQKNPTTETPAERRRRALELLKPEVPPPPGSNGMDLVFGHWPGDESDEEVRQALDEIE